MNGTRDIQHFVYAKLAIPYILGAALSAWAGWRLQGWRVRMAAPAPAGAAAK